jgi:molybdenum cofactor guanylyltransferase
MDGNPHDLAAFILAGGKSTRMGMDKCYVTLDGRTLLARALDLARSITSEVYIVGERAKFVPFAPVVEDIFANCGPLGGIHAALAGSQKELNVILAVDIPFISFALLQFLISRARSSDAAATVAQASGYWQPLCAVYRRDFAPLAEGALRAGHYKIDALFDRVKLQAISAEELEVAGFAPAIFRNLNTPEELSSASTAKL